MNRIVTAFWTCLLAFTLLSGSFLYPWAADESFDPARHLLLAEHPTTAPNEDIVMIPDAWQSRRTGEVFSTADFTAKRLRQACWNAVKLALLVTVGACFQIVAKRPDDHCRTEIWLWAGAAWLLLTFLCFYRVYA